MAPKKKPQQAKQLIFLLVIALAIALALGSFAYLDIISRNALWIGLLLAFLIVLWKADFIIFLTDYERAVIFRFGKVNRVGGPGWALFLPGIESYSLVDLRVQTADIPPQKVVTNDNIELEIDAVMYLKIMKDDRSVISSVVEVVDYKKASSLYITALIRDIIGSMKMSEVIASVEKLNSQLRDGLKKISEGWGVMCDAVEITDVRIPKTVLEAMHLEKAAEQEKLARVERAEAHKAEIDAVRHAAEQLSDKAISYYYIRALEKMSEGKATKIVFPMELSRFASLLAANISGGQPKGGSEELVEKYAPILLEYLKAEKRQRERPKPKKKR